MYAELRLLSVNAVTDPAMLTLSSQSDGVLSGVKTVGAGVAAMTVVGPYRGRDDMAYEVVCDSVAAGPDVGQATIKWRSSLTPAATWEAVGVLTGTTPAVALSADGRGTNIGLSFVGGLDDDFVLDDARYFEARAVYGPASLLDRDRRTGWLATGCAAESIVIDYGSPCAITAALLHDHNLTPGAVVVFQANGSNTWADPAYSVTIDPLTDPVIIYPEAALNYRYNRWTFADPSNPDGAIRIANLLTTQYAALEQPNAAWGSVQRQGVQMQANESEPGILRRYVYGRRQAYLLRMGDALSNADVAALAAVQSALIDPVSQRIRPLWVHWFSDEVEWLRLMDWRNIDQFSRELAAYLLNANVDLEFDEVMRV